MKKHVTNFVCAVALLGGLVGVGSPNRALAASAAGDAVCSFETVNYSWGYQVWRICETVHLNMQTLDAEVEITSELVSVYHYA